MNSFTALAIGVAVSLALSTATVGAIQKPLHRLLEAVCPLQTTAAFWTRAAVTVLYLMPLWVVLVFGLPAGEQVEFASTGDVARRALACGSFALVSIVVATGLRLSSLRAPSTYDYPPPVR